MQARPTQADAVNDDVAALTDIREENLSVSQNVITITDDLNEGEVVAEFITPSHEEKSGPTSIVLESVLKNIPAFDPKPDKTWI